MSEEEALEVSTAPEVVGASTLDDEVAGLEVCKGRSELAEEVFSPDDVTSEGSSGTLEVLAAGELELLVMISAAESEEVPGEADGTSEGSPEVMESVVSVAASELLTMTPIEISDSDSVVEAPRPEEVVSETSADVIDGVFVEVVSELPALPLVVVAGWRFASVAEMSELEDSTSTDASADAAEELNEAEKLVAEGPDEFEEPNEAEEPDEA
jgi:hypothetical protein